MKTVKEATPMKKKVIITIAIVALLACSVIFAACSDAGNAEQKRNAEYQNIALAAVGATGQKVQYSSVANRRNAYVVEVVINGVKYDVTIDENKTVLSVKINDRQVDKDNVPTPPYADETQYIGAERAKQIAFEDAATTVNSVTKLDVEFDFDDGKYLYEVEFRVGAVKYEYDIDATTGEIHKKEVDDKTVIEKAPEGVEFIGIEEAQRLVLANANVTLEEVVVKKAKLDFEKGSYVYEIEFVKGTVEYDYEINAVTGAVIKCEIDTEDDDDEKVPAGQYISVEDAKRTAFAHAGVSAESVVLEKAELDVERGIVVYEIEFKAGGYEYEYEINATTGDIISQDKEIDD